MTLARPFKIQNGIDFSLNHLEDELSKNKVQWLDLASWLWLALKGLPLTKTIYAHFTVIM